MTYLQTVLYIITLFFGAISLCLFLRLRVKACSAKAAVVKSWVSVFFILSWLATSYAKGLSAFAAFIGGGLLFGLLGDIWLDLKFCYEPDNDFYTKMGFLSFGIGHAFYSSAVISGTKGGFKPIAILPACGVAVLAAAVVFFGEKAMKLHYGKYKIISTVYGGILFFMAAFAFFSALFGGFAQNTHLIVMSAGGVLFIISDLILSGTYFGEGKNRPVDIVTNHVSYYASQFVIAAAVLFLK
ncbi:MAG: hypothetical protein J1E34_09965 [Oscillospiraceae bacterium]|nr:hypothetical protein [Oscillospiraceae bacterium]